jgi:phosphatidylglycerophosphate synthase
MIDPVLGRVAIILRDLGFSANAVTWLGFAIGLSGAACIALGWFGAALALVAVNRILDGLDGCIARLRGPTDLGGFLDIALDMIFYSSVPFAFALLSEGNQLPAAFLIYSFIGTGSSFLAFAIVAAKQEGKLQRSAHKSFFYSAGLIEGTETVIFLLLVCAFPNYFPVMAWVFGVLCWLTTVIRIVTAIFVFSEK